MHPAKLPAMRLVSLNSALIPRIAHQIPRFPAASLLYPAMRLSSTTSAPPATSKPYLIYRGPSSSPLRNLKKVSVTTLGVSFGITPLMGLLDFTQVSPGFVGALIFSVLSTSVASTALIYHFTKPYTVNLYYHPEPSPNPKGPLVTFETLSLFGNPVFTTVRAGQLGATTRPFTTFKVADKTGVQPPETPNGQLEYRKALEGFVEKMAKRPWKAREYFYLLEDRGVGNEVEGREKEFDEVMTAAGRRKAD